MEDLESSHLQGGTSNSKSIESKNSISCYYTELEVKKWKSLYEKYGNLTKVCMVHFELTGIKVSANTIKRRLREMLQDMFPGIKSTCGLSNISNGPPDHLRPILNQTYMVMLERKKMYSCIADAYDDPLIAIARGERPDIVEIVYKVMDGEEINIGSLSKEMQDYVKTARVILGHSLYSDSWLEL